MYVNDAKTLGGGVRGTRVSNCVYLPITNCVITFISVLQYVGTGLDFRHRI
jgi:hypothetical protein